jgi:hypothetical protein
MPTRIQSRHMHIAKDETSSDLMLKIATTILMTIAATILLVHIESHFIGQRALELLSAEHHIAAYF